MITITITGPQLIAGIIAALGWAFLIERRLWRVESFIRHHAERRAHADGHA